MGERKTRDRFSEGGSLAEGTATATAAATTTTVEETTGERKVEEGGWQREEGQEGSQKMWGRRFDRP